MLDELHYILAPLSERRDIDGHHAYPVVKILPEFSSCHQFFQILVRRSDDPYIQLYRPVASHRHHFTLLYHSQQLHLKIERQFIHFIQEYRAAVGHAEISFLSGFLRTGKSALYVPEHLRFEQILRDSPAVYFYKRLHAPRALAADQLRQDLLACSRLALYEYRRVKARDFFSHLDSLLHISGNTHYPAALTVHYSQVLQLLLIFFIHYLYLGKLLFCFGQLRHISFTGDHHFKLPVFVIRPSGHKQLLIILGMLHQDLFPAAFDDTPAHEFGTVALLHKIIYIPPDQFMHFLAAVFLNSFIHSNDASLPVHDKNTVIHLVEYGLVILRFQSDFLFQRRLLSRGPAPIDQITVIS